MFKCWKEYSLVRILKKREDDIMDNINKTTEQFYIELYEEKK